METALVAILLAIHFGMGLTALVYKGPTVDEPLHVAGGYAYWRFSDYRLQPENGNLPQRLAAAPLLFGESPAWPAADAPGWAASNASWVARDVFYSQGNLPDWMLFRGRAVIGIVSCLLGLTVFLWTRRLFDSGPALLALAVYAFCPNILAHGFLTTSDITAALFFLLSIATAWSGLRRPGIRSALLFGLSFGGLCVSKYSAVLLFPVFGVLWIWNLIRPPHGGTPIDVSMTEGKTGPVSQRNVLRTAFRSAVSLASGFLIAWALIWIFYGLRFSGPHPDAGIFEGYVRTWDFVRPSSGAVAWAIDSALTLRLLPEAFLYGFSFVLKFSEARSAFFQGDLSITGWRMFFPVAFLIKTPLPVLALMLLGVIAVVSREVKSGKFIDEGLPPLAVFFTVYWVAAILSNLNIGHRHLLPIYPVVFILAGASLKVRLKESWLRLGLPLVLCGWLILESLSIRPHYLTYFNQTIGGPAHGYRHLVDSSLDWGQDLPALAPLLQEIEADDPNPQVLYLSYFGSGDPDYYGIRARYLPSFGNYQARPAETFEPGIYAISVTMLQNVYTRFRGAWSLDHEYAYQELRTTFRTEAGAEELAARSPEDRDQIRQLYDHARFARLCLLLRAREPDERIGWSIHIYRVTDDDIRLGLDEPLDRLLQAYGDIW